MKLPKSPACTPLARSLALLLCAPLALAFASQDVDKDLKSKNPATREAAVRLVAEQGGERAEKQLLTALKDDDWLVLLAAIDGLAGHGTRNAVKPLLELARAAPFRVARERAAAALAKCAPKDAAEALVDDLRGKNGPVALPALAALAAGGARPESTERLERWLKDEATSIRVAAARAAVLCAAPETRGAALTELFKGGDLAMCAAGLEALTAQATLDDLTALAPILARAELAPVLERRAEAAAVAALAGAADERARAERFRATLLGSLSQGSGSDMGAGHGARLARIIAALGAKLPRAEAEGWLVRFSKEKEVSVRAAAAKALLAIGGDDARVNAVKGLSADTDGRVRAQYARTAIGLGAAATPEGEAALVQAAADADVRVREAAVVGLGRDGASVRSVAALVQATKDQDWELAVTATVALGRTRADVALRELAALARHTDWRLRGAAAMGLFHLAKAEAIAPLLTLLSDPNPCVVATAAHALAIHAGREGELMEPKEWVQWWQENTAKVRFQTPEEVRARREKYGYSVPDRDIYRGLDVVVVPGRGDLMENVLGRLEIVHRTVQAGQLGDGALHPFAILVAGCTGELEQRDLDVVRWYVRAGGALFTSCWALTYTVDASFKGLVTKFPSPAEVLDRVSATPVALNSPYLTGVFDAGVVPIYELQGAHLIQVLDPERVEVLVDSPEAALRHGSGDLAAWFRAGHGVVLDSVNHFDLQGLEAATDLKEAAELQGYAVDHMGLSLLRLRELADAKWWNSRSKAAQEIDDLSAFRILTNFVREKRINGT